MTDLDTGTPDLLVTVTDGIATVTLSRPERRNALSMAMLAGLRQVLPVLRDDDAVRVVVVTGSGGAFCAGGDVKRMAVRSPGSDDFDARVAMRRGNHRDIALQLWQLPKPTIAALPGPAAGAGLGIALACDLRYAVTGTFLTTAFARVGLAGDFGVAWFLTQQVGPARARELLYFSERVSAADAHRIGLVHEVFDTDDFVDQVRARARLLASGPTVAYAAMKENVNRAALGELPRYLDNEALLHTRSEFTDEHRQAARAFAEHRPPTLLTS